MNSAPSPRVVAPLDDERSSSFASLVDLELSTGTAEARPQPRGSASPVSDGARIAWAERAASDVFGLSLSGGGIRSATFNLGLLQALNDLGILRAFDYVSTVSGGGYIGSFWTAWRSRPDGKKTELFPAAVAEGRVEPAEIRHLREFSNFLSPRLGILAYDTGRMLVAALSATVPALFAALSVIILALGGWLWLTHLLLGGPATDATLGRSLWTLGVITGSVFIIAEVAWMRRGERWTTWYVAGSAVGLAATIGLWYALVRAVAPVAHLYSGPSPYLPFIANDVSIKAWRWLFLPAGVWMLAALVLVVLRWLFSRTARDPEWRVPRSAFDRVASRVMFSAAAWTVIAALWVAGTVLWYWLTTRPNASTSAGLAGLAGTTAALGLLFRTVQKLVTRSPGPSFGGKFATLLKPKLPQLLAYLTVAGLVVTTVALIVSLGSAPWTVPLPFAGTSLPSLWTVFAAAGAITLVTLLFFDPNEVGLHSFYRARLARAYLGASNPVGARQTEEQAADDLYLDRLSPTRPLHLVCCAANDLSSADHLGNLHRGAVSAALSRVGFSVGSDWTAWRKDGPMVPTLASAMTASAAAFNSHMGSKSMAFGPAVTFLMTAFNLRLGLWLPHPTTYAKRGRRVFPGAPFYEEMLGLSRANGTHVLLSDGGHFENMALYELIRRHCRFIIASDCGADPDVGFDDLGNVVRRVREDFGVEIDIDLSPLRPDEDGLARQPMVAGDIHYPNGDVGILLVFKPTLVGDEPADVTQYRRRNGAFPHESTGDQFYDEAQWESYRRLGAHAARSAFRGVVDRTGTLDDALVGALGRRGETLNDAEQHLETQRWASRIFARARMRWLAIPRGLEGRIDRIADRAAELDALLQKNDCGRVLREVYKEIPELDRLAQQRGLTQPADGAAAPAAATAAATPGLPPREDLAPSLHLIRRAILFMEEVYVTEDLDRNYNHPLYLGVMNYFARWAYAPLFRMWWPLLKSLYAERFTSFAERQFKLKGVASEGTGAETVIGRLTSADEGFAMHCWRLEGGAEAGGGLDVVSYSLQMRYQAAAPYHIQAAQVLVRRIDKAAVWDARQFFVPPGLWGIGIGEDFLDRLVLGRGPVFDPGGPLAGIVHLVVRIAVPAQTNAVARKEGSDVTQMYRAAGFREVFPSRATQASDGEMIVAHPNDPIPVGAVAFADGNASRWLVRCVEGRCTRSQVVPERTMVTPP